MRYESRLSATVLKAHKSQYASSNLNPRGGGMVQTDGKEKMQAYQIFFKKNKPNASQIKAPQSISISISSVSISSTLPLPSPL